MTTTVPPDSSTTTRRQDAVAQRQLAPAVPEAARSAAARPWRPYADDPLLTPAMTLGPEYVPASQMQALRRYLGALVAARNTPVHVNVAFNACYFGYDLTTGYAGAAVDPASFPTVALGQTIDALPVGTLINVASGGDPIWAEVVYKEGAHSELGDDGAVPSWLSGAPAGATGPAQTDLHSQPVLQERLVLDLDVFGLAPTAAQIARLTRRGRFDELGHLLVGSRYATAELAELDDAGFYRHYLLGAGHHLLFSTAAPAPLPLLLTEDAGPEQHQAALDGLFATVTAALHELDTVRMWQSYAVSRTGLSARLRSCDALGADDIASLASSTARSALPDQSRRLDAARQVTYTALGSRLRCVDGSATPMHGAGYAVVVLHANLIEVDVERLVGEVCEEVQRVNPVPLDRVPVETVAVVLEADTCVVERDHAGPVAADRWDRRPDGVEGLHEVLVLHGDLAVLGDQAQKGLDGVLQPVDRERGQRRRLSALLGRCGGLVADQRDPAGVGRGERHAEAPQGVGSTPAESRPAAALLLAAWRRLPISLPGVGAGHKTAVMAAAPPDLENVIHDLLADPVNAAEARTRAPATTGLYAWWAAPHVLPTLAGPPHPSIGNLRLLYVGIATSLRSRLASNHMRRSGSSTLRRTLAGLLLDDEQYRTRWTDRVVLIDDDETRLTDWMTKHLHVSWCAHPAPRDVEEAIIRGLRPPLNVEHASGPAVDLVKAARRRYYASAGARPGA